MEKMGLTENELKDYAHRVSDNVDARADEHNTSFNVYSVAHVSFI